MTLASGKIVSAFCKSEPIFSPMGLFHWKSVDDGSSIVVCITSSVRKNLAAAGKVFETNELTYCILYELSHRLEFNPPTKTETKATSGSSTCDSVGPPWHWLSNRGNMSCGPDLLAGPEDPLAKGHGRP